MCMLGKRKKESCDLCYRPTSAVATPFSAASMQLSAHLDELLLPVLCELYTDTRINAVLLHLRGEMEVHKKRFSTDAKEEFGGSGGSWPDFEFLVDKLQGTRACRQCHDLIDDHKAFWASKAQDRSITEFLTVKAVTYGPASVLRHFADNESWTFKEGMLQLSTPDPVGPIALYVKDREMLVHSKDGVEKLEYSDMERVHSVLKDLKYEYSSWEEGEDGE